MPMRETASYCRPRLYDRDDPEKNDDVALTIEALDTIMEMAMATGDKERVEHASDLKARLIKAAGSGYERDSGPEENAGEA